MKILLILALMLWWSQASAQYMSYRAKPVGMGGPCLDGTILEVVSGQWDCPLFAAYTTVAEEGTNLTQRSILNFIGTNITCVDNSGSTRTDCTLAAVAPVDATYITQTANATLTNEQAMGALTTGLVKNTTTTGVQSIYAGTTCLLPNVVRVLDASGAATCTEPSDSTGNSATTTLATAATALAANGTNCSAASFPLGVDASGNSESCTTLSSSNAGTATALAANGTNCSAASFPLGVDASGNAESCTTLSSSNAGTATALAADPTDCSSNQFANAIAASGNLTCAQINFNQLTGTDAPSASNITTGTLPAAQLPNPSSSTLGGVQSLAAVTSKWINTISTSGVPSATQPAFSDISGTDAPAISNVTGLGTGVATFLATPSSANFAAAITDESGTGKVILQTNPALITPDLGTPSAGVMTNVTGTAVSLHVSASNADSGTLPAAQLPTATTTAYGGVKDIAAVSGSYVDSLTSGVPHLTPVWQTWQSFSGNGTAQTCTVGGVNLFIAVREQNATEASLNSRIIAPFACTAKSMYVKLGANVPASESLVVTLDDQTATTTITCTIAAGASSCNDTTHTVSIAAGDLLDVKSVCSGSTSAISTAYSVAVGCY